MKKGLAVLLTLVLMLGCVPALRADTLIQVGSKAYNVEVRSVQVVWNATGTFKALETVRTTGRKTGVNKILFRYDAEEEGEEATGQFTPDEKVALVCVDGFEPELSGIADAALVTVTVDGEPIQNDEAADYAGYVGWQNVHSGSYGVVFPVFLEKESRTQSHIIQVRALNEEGQEIVETAHITLMLENERTYKEERIAHIIAVEGTHVQAYLVDDHLYLDFPTEAYDAYMKSTGGEASVTLTFAGEDGQPIEGRAWALPPQYEEEPADKVLDLEKETRLNEGAVRYGAHRNGATLQRPEVVFAVETPDAMYRTAPYLLIERHGIQQPDPQGIYFARSVVTLEVGETLFPEVRTVSSDSVLCAGGTGALTLTLGEGSDRTPVEVTEEGAIVGVQPGVTYVTAQYETDRIIKDAAGALSRVIYQATSMKVEVVPRQSECWRVSCRLLNVRGGAGTEYAVLRLLERGQEVRVRSICDGWAELEEGGYVSARYLAR